MTGQETRCRKCGKTKQAKQASITQWLSSCNCDLIVHDDSVVPSEIDSCQSCGKRIDKGRPGSFTQWIFRADLCSCQKPNPIKSISTATKTSPDTRSEKAEPQPDIEIAVDCEFFPSERYMPLEKLGSGASGAVYLCRDRILRTKVAVKTLRVLDGEQLVSFQKEAQATSKLNHPNLIKVLNFGASEDGSPYMVMEYFPGENLQLYLTERGPLPQDLCLNIFAKLCDALGTAHKQHIFHRDIKTSNILISTLDDPQNPDVRLIDFGLALVKNSHQGTTQGTGISMVGTPAYMPPDQALGRPYDANSEVYALGCALFEALTGRPPFVSETALETISRHANEIPPRLAEVNPDFAYLESVELLVAKCLKKDPDDRFQSMREMKKSCQAILSRELTSRKKRDTRETTNVNRLIENRNAASKKLNRKLLIGTICVLGCFVLFAVPNLLLLIESMNTPIGLESPGEAENQKEAESATEAETPQVVRHFRPSKEISSTVLPDTPGETTRVSGDNLPNKSDTHTVDKLVDKRINNLATLRTNSTSEAKQPIYEKNDSSLLLEDGDDQILNTIPEQALVKKLRLERGTFSREALKAFASRPGVDIESLTLSHWQNLNPALAAICSSRNTKLRSLELDRCEVFTNKDVKTVAHQPIEFFLASSTAFEKESMLRMFKLLSKSGVQYLNLSSVEVPEECGDFLAKLQALKKLSVAGEKLPDSAFLALTQLRRLQEISLQGFYQLDSAQVRSLVGVPHLSTLSITDQVISTAQLKTILQRHKISELRLARRDDLVSDLKAVSATNLPALYITLHNPIDNDVLAMLKTMKRLKALTVENFEAGDFVSQSSIQDLKNYLPRCSVRSF